MRTEKDILGEISLDDNCLYGINTARAKKNFNVSGRTVHKELIHEHLVLKKAAAEANADAGLLEKEKADYISAACDKLISDGDYSAFVTDSLQGGAGTSLNMNVNEVVANTALALAGKRYGDYSYINPLDDVNKNQSTNDIYPTALRIAAIKLLRQLSDECAKLQSALQDKEKEYSDIPKIGRTELMNAVEITLGDEFGAYAQAISRDRWRIYKAEERLRYMNIGGTAVGKTVDKRYVFRMTELIRRYSGFGMARAEYPMDITQNCDVFADVSGFLKALAVSLIKIANDLRLMNGNFLSEIKLAPMQTGSTAMPHKINPVIPEMTVQAAVKVISNDSAISMCASMGNFELNAFLPLIADCLLDSLKLLKNAVFLFRTKCIEPLKANPDGCKYHLEHSLAFAMEYVPKIGYKAVEKLLSECGGDREKFIEAADSIIDNK